MRYRARGRPPVVVLLGAALVTLWICGSVYYYRMKWGGVGGGVAVSFKEEGAEVASVNEEELGVRKYHEHLKGMADVSRLRRMRDTWEEHSYNKPFLDKERYVKCDVQHATLLNTNGVNLARAALGSPTAFPPDLETAKSKFRESIRKDPKCITPVLNLAMLLLSEAVAIETPLFVTPHRLGEAQELFENLPVGEGNTPTHAKYLWWQCIFEEILVNGTSPKSANLYRKATEMSPDLITQHIHAERLAFGSVLSPIVRAADYYTRRALVRFQMYYEYMPTLAGYPKVTYQDAHNFARDWHIAIDNALPPYCFAVAAGVYRYLVDENMLGWNGQGYRGSATHESLADPLNTWLNVQVVKFIEKLSTIKVRPTYGYSAGYIEGDVLKPHTDRNACEFTLTTLIMAYPHVSSCPLYVQRTPWSIDSTWVGRFEEGTVQYNDSVNLHPQLNQWLVIRGRAKPHFRPALPKHTACSTLLSHFVPSDA